jgi:hypothetical protein
MSWGVVVAGVASHGLERPGVLSATVTSSRRGPDGEGRLVPPWRDEARF